jgi:hypothetical protein
MRAGVTTLGLRFFGPFNVTPIPDGIFGGGTRRAIIAGDGGASVHHVGDPYVAAFLIENIFNDFPGPAGRRFFGLALKQGTAEAITGGPNVGVRHWDPTPPPGFGFTQIVPFEQAANGRLYGNDPLAGGAILGGTRKLNLVTYDARNDLFGVGDALGFFPVNTIVVSGYRATATSTALAISDGTPGRLWTHTGTGTPVDRGEVGNAPRDVNLDGSVGVVANNGSDSLTVFTFDGTTATIRGTVAVGDGPVFANMRALPNGNKQVLSTGFNDGSLWSTTIEPDGDVVANVRLTSFICNEPAEAEFDVGVFAFVPCHADDTVLRVDLSAVR